MFGWRRRSEGFEWQEYVRTTVLVRRADRQRRVDDARLAAIGKVQQAKDRGIEVGKAGLDRAADQAARAAKATGRTIGDIALASIFGAGDVLKSCRDVAVKIVTPYLPQRPPADATPERPVHERYAEKREQRRALEAQPPPPRTARAPPILVPNIGPMGRKVFSYAMRAAALVAVILVAGRMLQSGEPGSGIGGLQTGSVIRAATLTAEPLELAGRAAAITGDMLRIDGRIVRLAGVAAPEDNQPCFDARNRRWSCSAAARKALDRMVRGKHVTCEPSGTDDAGLTRAKCEAKGEDLARAMARAGHVFADAGVFASYRDDEQAAKTANAGVWQGEAVRPEEWRTRVWEEAKRTAPDGCPIRGVIRAGENIYAMPWSSDYNGARFRVDKNERWFCSEQDARDAGYKPSLKS